MFLRGMADSGPGQEMYNGGQRRESKEATNNHDKVANLTGSHWPVRGKF